MFVKTGLSVVAFSICLLVSGRLVVASPARVRRLRYSTVAPAPTSVKRALDNTRTSPVSAGVKVTDALLVEDSEVVSVVAVEFSAKNQSVFSTKSSDNLIAMRVDKSIPVIPAAVALEIYMARPSLLTAVQTVHHVYV